jgi:hypothetical protein
VRLPDGIVILTEILAAQMLEISSDIRFPMSLYGGSEMGG